MADVKNIEFTKSYKKEQETIKTLKLEHPTMIIEDYQFRSDNPHYREMQEKGYDAKILIDGEPVDVDFKCATGMIIELLTGNTSNPKANRIFGDKEEDRPIIWIDDPRQRYFYGFNSLSLKQTNLYKYYQTRTPEQIIEDAKLDMCITDLRLRRNKLNEPFPGVFVEASPTWFYVNNVPLFLYDSELNTIE